MICERLCVSFGVWNILASMLAQNEFVKLQGLNHFAYDVNISRCQTSYFCDEHMLAFHNSLLSDPEYYFSYPNWTKFEKTIIKLDNKRNEVELLKNDDFRARFSKTVQIDSELYSVEKARVVKYSGL